ncbi:MAG TPA: lactate racemase domain-containing protein [Limnochordia bacterium]|nr:lactate racemase domain-containing protein [Limnochordia bacterium]HXK96853.1 lactate racemase domain-containing protein [Limnochordia bacterium]
MGVVSELVKGIPIPRMVKVSQKFDDPRLADVEGELRAQLRQEHIQAMIKPGMTIAVAVGSRGVNRIADIVRVVVEELKALQAEPFIVPSMGSHGGASAEGQKEVLRHLGITEDSVGAPIRSSMEVNQIASLENGLPVYVDRFACQADGIVVINRVKPHTAFRGPIESGLMKMLAIGLGKQKGAEACHQLGFKHMAEFVPTMAKVIMDKLPVLFGVATVENAFDQVMKLKVIPASEIEGEEKELLKIAKANMPKLWFDQIDVLVIDEIGKNISGDGFDPNVVGRYPTPYAYGGPDVTKIVVLDLTDETEGNANGIGTADFTTRYCVDKIDYEKIYANGLTSTVVAPTKIPTTLENDREAIQAAIKTCNILDFTKVRLVRIKNTLQLAEIEVSEPMIPEVESNPNLNILSAPYDWEFDANGNLTR